MSQDKPQQKKTFELMPLAYYEAMEMRFLGFTYKEISKKVELSEGHLRVLFHKNGILHDAYQDYVAKEVQYRVDHTREIFSAHIEEVARRFVTIVTSGKDIPAIMAGKEILERVLGKVKDDVNLNHSGGVGVALVDMVRAVHQFRNELQQQQSNDGKTKGDDGNNI